MEYKILRRGSLLVVHWLKLSPPHSPRRHTFLHFTFYISHEQDKTEICFELKSTTILIQFVDTGSREIPSPSSEIHFLQILRNQTQYATEISRSFS